MAGRSSLPALFETAGLSLDVALTARDADVIKTYVRVGLGVGILACVAIDPKAYRDLVVHTTWIGFRRVSVLRAFRYDFVELLAPHLPKRLIRKAEQLNSQQELDRKLEAITITRRS